MSRRVVLGLALLLLALLVAGCGRAPAGADPQVDSPMGLTRAPLDLVVLHTNDNWGETEPCG